MNNLAKIAATMDNMIKCIDQAVHEGDLIAYTNTLSAMVFFALEVELLTFQGLSMPANFSATNNPLFTALSNNGMPYNE